MSTVQYSTATYEGWKLFAEWTEPPKPARLSRQELSTLGEAERDLYNEARHNWHGNILLRTPQVDEVHDHLHGLVGSNVQRPGFVRPAAAIDAPPSLGKSTTLDAFGKDFYLAQIRAHGPNVGEDSDVLRIPVCKIQLPGEVTIKGLHLLIDRFYAHPAAEAASRGRMPSRDLASSAAECVRRHDTRLVLIDDIHFLNPRTENGEKVANELKWLANEYPATFVFAGVGLEARGLFSEGGVISARDGDQKYMALAFAQTGRRWTHLEMKPFDLQATDGESAWHNLLLAVEQKLVLARMMPGMLVDLHDYLFVRSTGVIGSLMELVRLGAERAIRTGHEQIDEALLERVKIDAAGEAVRGLTAKRVVEHRQRNPMPDWKKRG